VRPYFLHYLQSTTFVASVVVVDNAVLVLLMLLALLQSLVYNMCLLLVDTLLFQLFSDRLASDALCRTDLYAAMAFDPPGVGASFIMRAESALASSCRMIMREVGLCT